MPTADDKPSAVILADGSYPSGTVADGILAGARKVVCCDGAAVGYIEHGHRPYAIVGDCDSLPAEMRERFAPMIHADADQESNDLTKAVRFCIAAGLRDIVIVGATGKREDHTLGNIGLMADYGRMEDIDSIRMITDYGVFDIIYGDTRFASFKGQQASVFTPDPAVEITTHDLLYPLFSAHLTAWWQGTLNQSLGDSFGIGTTGTAIVFREFR